MIRSRLLNIMQNELGSQKLQLSPYCTQQIEQLVSNGIKRMHYSKAIDNAGHVMQAERNLKALVQYFSDYSRKAGTYPNLQDTDFDAALVACPTLWPFCSSG